MIKGFKKYIAGAANPWDWYNTLVGQLDSNARETDDRLKKVEKQDQCGLIKLTAGTYIVPNAKVTEKSIILLTSQYDSGTPGFLRVSSRVIGSSFTILSSNGADTSTIGWVLIEPRS